MSNGNRFIDTLKSIQRRFDLTPMLIRLSARFARSNRVSIAFFIFFLLAGAIGLFLPIIQGIPTILLAFTFLGIRPLNNFIQSNQTTIENFGAVLFFVAFFAFFLNLGAWGLGVVDDSPLQNAFDFVNLGKDGLSDRTARAFSVVGVDYLDLRQSLSIADFDKTQGFSIAGVS